MSNPPTLSPQPSHPTWTASVGHYENFPVASWLCPKALRPAVMAIYHFARTADDIADEGSASTAINAMEAAAKPHHFLGISQQGNAAIVSTTGNPDGHLVLRGGKGGPNYGPEAVAAAAAQLAAEGLPARLMVDCSHGNSNKDYRRQGEVLRQVAEQVAGGSLHVMGVMLESHLVEGSQKIPADLSQLTYGQSITDACIALDTTLALLDELAGAVRRARQGHLVTA